MMSTVTLGKKLRLCLIAATLAVTSGCGLAMDSEDRLDRTAAALEAGNYRAAIIGAKDVLRDNPDSSRGRVLLGRASVEVGDGAGAEKEFRRAVQLGVPVEAVVVDLGRALLLQHKARQVIDEISLELAGSEADRLKIMQIRGDSWLRLGEAESARESFDQILQVVPEDIDAQLGIAASYIAERNFTQSRSVLDHVVGEHGDNVKVRVASGMLNLQVQRFSDAESEFAAAYESRSEDDPTDTLLQLYRGFAESLLAQERTDDARSIIEELEGFAPNSIPALELDSRLAYLEEDWPRAQQRLQQILQFSPDYRPAQLLLGAVQLQAGNLEQAEMYLTAVIAAESGNRRARQLLAETRLQMARVDEARQVLGPLMSREADPQTMSLAARVSVLSGETDDAIEILERAITEEPGNVGLLLQLALTYFDAGRAVEGRAVLEGIDATGSEDAEYVRDALVVVAEVSDGDYIGATEAAQSLVEKWPESGRAEILLGTVYLRRNDVRSARSSFEAGARKSSYDLLSRRYLALLEERVGNDDAADSQYLAILDDTPDTLWAMHALAQNALDNGDSARAQEWLEKVRALDDKSLAARMSLARLYLIARDYGAARTVAEEILKIDPALADGHNLLGLSRSGQEDYQGALNAFRRAAQLDNSNPIFSRNLAAALNAMGDTERAVQLLEQSSDANDIPSSVMLARIKSDSDAMPEALAVAAKLQDARPDSPVPFALEGELYVKAGDLNRASTAYDKALSISATKLYALRSYTIKRELNSPEWASPLLAYLEEKPLDSSVRLILADAYQSVGDNRRAIFEYESVVSAEPNNVTAMNNLAWNYYLVKDDRAEAMARKAYDIEPENGSVVDTLGWVLVEYGNAAEGVKYLRQAVSLTNNHPDVQFHLAGGLAKTGEVDEARANLQRLLRGTGDFSTRSDAERLLEQL